MADSISFAPSAPPADPDAQTTITDFVDYTEYFPSDLFRSLTLIGKLDAAYQEHANEVHRLTKQYGSLPSLENDEHHDAQELRKQTSLVLYQALRCRDASYAEALRLCNLTDNLYEHLQGIRAKLEAQPKPPSREPTPPPKSNRSRKADTDRQPRIKLLSDGQSRSAPRPPGIFSRRRIIVPGDVLPPRDPNSPASSEYSDSESERAPTPYVRPTAPRIEKEKTPRPPKPERPKVPKSQKVRPPGAMGTNVHSTVAGISVTNAMAQLSAPPENPPLGSKHAPWNTLTEWELHQIRKRMKKNADWMPSAVMVNRELKEKNRGEENKRIAKEHAEATGEPFFDEEPEKFVRQPLVMRKPSSEPRLALGEEEPSVNRGMKLNEAKKLKREQMLQEQREQAAKEAEDALADAAATKTETSQLVVQPKRSHKKRKRTSSTAPAEQGAPEVAPVMTKKIKLSTPGPRAPANAHHDSKVNQTEQQSAAGAGDAGIRTEDKHSKRSSRSGTAAAKSFLPSTDAPSAFATSSSSASATRPRSKVGNSSIKLTLPAKKAASAEPEKPRPTIRRTSDTGPFNRKAATTRERNMVHLTETAASRRGKRPAPGVLATDGPGVKLSLGKRKNATSKVDDTEGMAGAVEGSAAKEEPRYCVCNDVSHGVMIACESANCPMEWFHVACVGLADTEKRLRLSRLHWFCPVCRGKAGVGEDGYSRK